MDSWDDCSVEVQAKILAFDQTMQHDENERDAQLAGARTPSGMKPSPSGRKPAASKGKKSKR